MYGLRKVVGVTYIPDGSGRDFSVVGDPGFCEGKERMGPGNAVMRTDHRKKHFVGPPKMMPRGRPRETKQAVPPFGRTGCAPPRRLANSQTTWALDEKVHVPAGALATAHTDRWHQSHTGPRNAAKAPTGYDTEVLPPHPQPLHPSRPLSFSASAPSLRSTSMDMGAFQNFTEDAADPFDKYANFSVRCFPPARASRHPEFQAPQLPAPRFEEFDEAKLTHETHDHFFSNNVHPPSRGRKYPRPAVFEEFDASHMDGDDKHRHFSTRIVPPTPKGQRKPPKVRIPQFDVKKLEETCPKYRYFSQSSLVHGQGHRGP